MKSQKLLAIFTGLFLLSLMNNCGSKNTPHADSAGDGGSTDLSSNNKVLADCSKASGQSIIARAQIAKDNYGNYAASHVRLKFDSIPNVYNTNSSYDLVLRLWTAAYNSETNTITKHYDNSNSAVMTFDLKSGNTYQALSIGAAYPLFLNKDEIQDVADFNNLDTQNPSEFFNKVVLNIDLKDDQGSYKVLEINFVDGSGVSQYSTNLLLPRFEANPDEYKASHENLSLLYDLHPLRNLLGSGFPTSHYVTEAAKSCL